MSNCRHLGSGQVEVTLIVDVAAASADIGLVHIFHDASLFI